MAFTRILESDRVKADRVNQLGDEISAEILKFSTFDLYLKTGNSMNTVKPTGAGTEILTAVGTTETKIYNFNYTLGTETTVSKDNRYSFVLPFTRLNTNRTYTFRYVLKVGANTLIDVTKNPIAPSVATNAVEFVSVNQLGIDFVAPVGTVVTLEIWAKSSIADTEIGLLVNDLNTMARTSRNEAVAIVSASGINTVARGFSETQEEFNSWEYLTKAPKNNAEFTGVLKLNSVDIGSAIGQNTHDIAQLSNPNLLINGDFQVWQRGVSFGTIPSNTYVADRWNNSEGCSLTEKTISGIKHITASNPSGLLQSIEDFDGKLSNKVVTLSVLMKASTQIRLAVNGASSNPLSCSDYTFLKFTTNTGTILSGKLPIGIRNAEFGASAFEIKYAKLELGDIATPFSPRPYAEELAMCQRYYRRELIASPCQRSTLQYDSVIIHNNPIPMRIVPTIKFFNVGETIENIVSDSNSNDVTGTFIVALNTIYGFYISYRDATTKVIPTNMVRCLVKMDAEIY